MDNMPTVGDFTDANETIIYHADNVKPDSYGRFQFTVFWLGHHPARGEGDGVRGQVFNTNLADFTTRERNRGRSVRVVTRPAEPDKSRRTRASRVS